MELNLNQDIYMFPKVFIILVNYNGYIDTVECVRSLLNINYSNYEILIIENGSENRQNIKNDTFLKNHAKIISSDTNLGFSGANNLGIKYALKMGTKYILLLNNDTIVTENFLYELVKCAEDNKATITTGNIAYYRDRETMWYSGGKYDFETGVTYMNWYKMSDNITQPQEVTFSTGCLMLINAKFIQEYGMLNEDYFLYSEDTEFCCRAISCQKKIIWNPNALIYHKVSASAKENSKFQQYYLIRNNFYIIQNFSTKKVKAYFKRIILSLKEIIKGNYSIIPFLDALKDFKNGIKGRSPKY